jgi:hypothetical protein
MKGLVFGDGMAYGVGLDALSLWFDGVIGVTVAESLLLEKGNGGRVVGCGLYLLSIIIMM